MANEAPPRPPPPLMANAIKNFHFDFLKPSLNTLSQGFLLRNHPIFAQGGQGAPHKEDHLGLESWRPG